MGGVLIENCRSVPASIRSHCSASGSSPTASSRASRVTHKGLPAGEALRSTNGTESRSPAPARTLAPAFTKSVGATHDGHGPSGVTSCPHSANAMQRSSGCRHSGQKAAAGLAACRTQHVP